MSDLLADDGGAQAPVESAAPVDNGTPTPQAAEPTAGLTLNIPEQFKEASWAQKYSTDEDFFNGVDNMSKMIGAKGTSIPDFENDPPEVIAAFREKLGVPSESTGYDFELPEGFEKNESFEAFTALAHKGNISKDVAKDLHAMGVAETQKAIEAYDATKSAEVDQAFEAFKQDPNFQEISNNVSGILQKVDPNGEILSKEDLNNPGPDLAPKIARLLNQIVSLTGDSSVIKGQSPDSVGGNRIEQKQKVMDDLKAGRITQDTANARINQISANFS
jgi:hypothetical protein